MFKHSLLLRYVDKRWVAKTATNPIAIPKGRNPRCNNKYDDWSSKNGIPKIPKGSSLDEQAFDSYMEKCPPVDLKTRTVISFVFSFSLFDLSSVFWC